jgi:hypothetical protein
MMSQEYSFNQIIEMLSAAGVPTRQLTGGGNVAVTPVGGRIVALAFSPTDPNLFWTNPELVNADLVRNHPEKLAGGLGGDRIWFAPELDYHWRGTPDWNTCSNYEVPASADPGEYRFVNETADAVTLHARIRLSSIRTGISVGFNLDRTVRLTPSPVVLDDGVEYVGIETCHNVEVDESTTAGRFDLWHILQVPSGGMLIVPFKPCASIHDRTALSYALPGNWVERRSYLSYRYTGSVRAKFGLGAAALTGRAGIVRQVNARKFCLIVRQFHVDPTGTYGDHPYGVERTDQAFQAWDGMGFGELEHHSPLLDAGRGPRQMWERDFIWAFGGSRNSIKRIAEGLLGTAAGATDTTSISRGGSYD